jgi:hypothetical protein
MIRRALLLLILAFVAAGCGTSAAPARTSSFHGARSTVPPLHHVVLLVLENREASPGGGPAYLRTLARLGARVSNDHGVTHPSLPNYLALLSGRTFGIEADVAASTLPGPTLVDELEGKHLAWDAYMEDMPGPCYRGAAAGLYGEKHNPFMYFPSIARNPKRCGHVLPMSEMWANLSRSLPAFVWITPNLCHDGHDCNDATVSAFLKATVPRILRLPAFHSGGLLAVTYDEGTTAAGCCRFAAGGRITTVLVGSGIRAGTVVTTPSDHYSLLRTIEDGFGLRHLGNAACSCTPSLVAAWKSHT